MDVNDVNVVVLMGRLSAPAEISRNDNIVVRLLIAARSDAPTKRLDLLPVVWWNPTSDELSRIPPVGSRVTVTGSVQRRYWEGRDGRRSRIELVAEQVTFPDDDPLATQRFQASETP
jgi:single-stranded DNA-binding protein